MVKNTTKLNMLTVFSASLLVLAPTCLGNEAMTSELLKQCQPAKNTSIGYLRCLDGKIGQLDNEKRSWGNNVIFMLEAASKGSGRTGVLRLFKKSQKNFDKYLESHCRWQFMMLLPDRTASAIKYKECAILLSEQRVVELKLAAK